MDHIKLSEDDLLHIFGGRTSKISYASKIIRYIALLTVIFVLSYIVINYVAFYKSISYWYQNDFQSDETSTNTKSGIVVNLNNEQNTNDIQSKLPNISENHLLIPKIEIDAPIEWQTSNTESIIQKKLENGVVHISGTAVPGQNGNIFITGHSSNYFWSKGSYKNVFALLNKLMGGDLIYLKYNNQVYVYKVIEIKTIKPSDVSVMQSNGKPILSLMTCTPVGTSINRLIIRSEQILPDSSKNTSFNSTTISSMPDVAR